MRRSTRTAHEPSTAHGGAPPRPGRVRRALPLLAWLGSLLAGVVLFHALGSGPLEPPSLTAPATWADWASAREPLIAVVAILRLVVLALAWYLVGVTSIGIVARLTRAARLVRIADALTIPTVRRLLQGALGLSLATAMVGAVSPAGYGGTTTTHVSLAGAQTDDEVRLRVAGDELRLTRVQGDHEVRLTMVEEGDGVRPVRVDGDAETTVGAPLPLELLDGAREASPDEVTMRQVIADDPASATSLHEAEAGESFWTIARDALQEAGLGPDDATLHAYWEQLIEENRHRLADPDNPDLIFPGQQLELPPLPLLGEGDR